MYLEEATLDRNYDCTKCRMEKPDCNTCEYNLDIVTINTAGPCGQQNCWFGCTVCQANGGCNYKP